MDGVVDQRGPHEFEAFRQVYEIAGLLYKETTLDNLGSKQSGKIFPR